MKILLLVYLILFTQRLIADDDLCKYFIYCGGGTSRGTSSQSLPSASSSAGLNPSTISKVKGFGIEAIYQPHNSVNLGVVSGTGKIGALISPTLENSFFGNRSIEIDDLFFQRRINKKQFENKKISFALGASFIRNRFIDFDLGVSLKRNPDIKKINTGFGGSLRIGPLNFGGYIYNDDVKLNLSNYINPYNGFLYSTIYGNNVYQEKFTVKTLTVGTQIKKLTLDMGYLKTKYKFYNNETIIKIYSASYNYKSFLFNYSLRKELSDNLAFENNNLVIKRNKNEIYFGTQYSLSRSLVAGIQYNYFLLHELSASLTIYF